MSLPSPSSESNLLSRATLVLGLLMANVALVHFNGLFGAFVFDDQGLLRRTSLRSFWDFGWFGLAKRPVAMATFSANFSFVGESPLGFHVVNWLIHLAAVAVLFLLVRRTMLMPRLCPSLDGEGTDRDEVGDRAAGHRGLATPTATATALLWGLHPLTTSAVTYIVQRYESFASLWILMCLFCWSKAFGRTIEEEGTEETKAADGRAGEDSRLGPDSYRSAWSVGAIASAYAAYGSKEIAVGVALIILLYDRYFLADSWRPLRARWAWYGLLALPLVLGLFVYVPRLIRSSSSGRSTIGFGMEGMSPWSYFTSQPRVFVRYLRMAFWPVGQALDYGWLPSRSAGVQWVGAAGWGILVGALVWLWRRSSRPAALIAAMLIVLAPTSTLIPLQDIIFEHRFYLPLAFLIAGLVGSLAVTWSRRERLRDFIGYRLITMACLISLPLAWLTTQRNLDFTSAERLHRQDCEVSPENPRAWYALGMTGKFDRPEPKIQMLSRAIELSDKRDFYYAGTPYLFRRDLADTLFLAGYPKEAGKYFEAAIEHCNTPMQETECQFRLALIASMQHHVDEAEVWFEKAMRGEKSLQPEIQQTYRAHRARVEQRERLKTNAAGNAAG